MTSLRPVVGMTYLLDEQAYKFGAGSLLVRVTRIIGPVDFGQAGTVQTWWEVEAMCRPPTATSPGQPRTIYLRADRLATGQQRADHGG
jgi:hypothetical protein